MREITLEELLEAGCHFGHQVTRHNPKSRDFVFEARDNIHIIDLAKTKEGLEAAGAFVKKLAQNGGTIIMLGAKRQARVILADEVQLAKDSGVDGMFAVTNRWIGGTLTNFSEVSKNYKKLADLTRFLKTDEERSRYTKKEIGLMERDRNKLISFYGGASDMKKIPDAVFIIDTHLENLAVREAHAMHVPTVGIVDTNADPTIINYPIPANDDAVGSLKLIIGYIVDAWIEGWKNQELGIKNKELGEKEEKKEEKTAEPEKKVEKKKVAKEKAAVKKPKKKKEKV